MRNRVITMIALASLILLGASNTPDVPPSLLRSDAPALEVEVSVAPVTYDRWQLLRRARPGMYRCTAFVHDEPGSHRVWGTKDIILLPGESDEETATLGSLQLQFKASVNKTADRAETTVTVSRDGKVINRQRSTIWLERAK